MSGRGRSRASAAALLLGKALVSTSTLSVRAHWKRLVDVQAHLASKRELLPTRKLQVRRWVNLENARKLCLAKVPF